MNSQIKYIVQGFLLMLLVLFVFGVVRFISSTETYTPASTTVDIDNVQKESVPVINSVEGQKLFNANCASCHAVYKRLTGPALAGFEQRGLWRDRKQIYAWIHNPSSYMKTNSYTKGLYKEYQVMMTPFPSLSNKDIDAIINFINESPVRYENQLPVAINVCRPTGFSEQDNLGK